MINRRHSVFRRAAWVAVFAMLLQPLIPALHHPAGMAIAGTLGLGTGKNLCLAPGSEPVGPAAPDKAPHHQPECAICQAIHAVGGFAPPDAPAIALPQSIAADFNPAVATTVLVRLPYPSQQPRAPPFFA